MTSEPSEPLWITHSSTYALYKPRGMLSSNKLRENKVQLAHRRQCMGAWLKELSPEKRIFHIGRLDKKTSGLILCTSFGLFGNFICTPGMLPKEYLATTDHEATEENMKTLLAGIELADGKACALEAEIISVTRQTLDVVSDYVRRSGNKKAKVKRKLADRESEEPPAPRKTVEKTTSVVRLVINIGKNHIVKRMMHSIGLPVVKLHRSAIGPLTLNSLNLNEPGESVKLTNDQIRTLWQARQKNEISLTAGDDDDDN